MKVIDTLELFHCKDVVIVVKVRRDSVLFYLYPNVPGVVPESFGITSSTKIDR